MQEPCSSFPSTQLAIKTLPSLMKDRKHLPNTINEYITEVNQELINLEKKQYGVLLKNSQAQLKLRKIPSMKKRPTLLKSSTILPVVMRLSSNSIKPMNQTAFINEKKFQSTPCLPNPHLRILKRSKLLEELKSINEESAYMNHNLLTDMSTYEDSGKRVNKEFQRMRSNKRRLLLKSDEFLEPEIENPLYQKHANDFYSYLDRVIDKVNGSTSIDLFKRMKMINEEKKKGDSFNAKQSQKRNEQVEKLLEETNQIKKRLSKNC